MEIYFLNLAGFIIFAQRRSDRQLENHLFETNPKDALGLHLTEYHHAGPVNQYFLKHGYYQQNLCFIHKKKVDILRSLTLVEDKIIKGPRWIPVLPGISGESTYFAQKWPKNDSRMILGAS